MSNRLLSKPPVAAGLRLVLCALVALTACFAPAAALGDDGAQATLGEPASLEAQMAEAPDGGEEAEGQPLAPMANATDVKLYCLDGTEGQLLSMDEGLAKYVVVGGTDSTTSNTLDSMAELSAKSAYDGVGFYLLDLNGDPTAFAEAYGDEEVGRVRVCSPASGSGVSYNAWAWNQFSAAGYEADSITIPFTVLIDSDGTLLDVLSGSQQVGRVCADYFNVEDPDLATIFLGITGVGDSASGRELLPMVNAARQAVGVSDLTWDVDLEKTALQRAAELSVLYSHTRPDGTDCFTAWPEGTMGAAENIAYGYTDSASVNTGWTNSPGHYSNMINENMTAFGAASFVDFYGCRGWVECFSSSEGSGLTGSATNAQGTWVVDVLTKNIDLCLARADTASNVTSVEIEAGEALQLALIIGNGRVATELGWSTGDSQVAEVDGGGLLAAIGGGETTVTGYLTYNENYHADATVTVTGEPVTDTDWTTCGSCEWRVTAAGRLEVRPLGFETAGLLAGWDEYPAWHDLADKINSVSFMGTIEATTCKNMFAGCSNLKSVSLWGLSTTYHATDMSYMFAGCSSLKSVSFSHLDTSKVTDMSHMFWNCSGLTSLDFSGLDTSSVTDMSHMFAGCSALESVDLSGLDTSSVTDMMAMFDGCSGLSSIDLSGLDTSAVKNVSGMFEGCSALASVDLSGLDTSSVTNMAIMFEGCSGLTSVDLSGIDTSKVTSMQAMFDGCFKLTHLDLSGLDASSVTSMAVTFYGSDDYIGAFAGCTGLASVSLPDSWPVALKGALPEPTAANGKWWSEAAGAWLTNEEIAARGKMADTLSSVESAVVGSPFSDVTGKTAHYDDILWLAESGISKGWDEKDGTKTFRPYNNVARADMAAFLFRLAKSWGMVDEDWEPTGKVAFADVTEKTAHYREIMWLAESGISQGWTAKDGTKTFRPLANVARADMAAFLGRLAEGWGIADEGWEPSGEVSFADVSGKTAHYREIMWLAETGISQGWTAKDGTKTFRPYANVARADMAAFLHRLDTLESELESEYRRYE